MRTAHLLTVVRSARGVSAQRNAGIHPPPWTEFLTHTCENIPFLQLLLQAV